MKKERISLNLFIMSFLIIQIWISEYLSEFELFIRVIAHISLAFASITLYIFYFKIQTLKKEVGEK